MSKKIPLLNILELQKQLDSNHNKISLWLYDEKNFLKVIKTEYEKIDKKEMRIRRTLKNPDDKKLSYEELPIPKREMIDLNPNIHQPKLQYIFNTFGFIDYYRIIDTKFDYRDNQWSEWKERTCYYHFIIEIYSIYEHFLGKTIQRLNIIQKTFLDKYYCSNTFFYVVGIENTEIPNFQEILKNQGWNFYQLTKKELEEIKWENLKGEKGNE